MPLYSKIAVDRKTATRAGLAVLILAHFAFLMAYFEPAVINIDAAGYFSQARLIATEGRTWFVPESELQHIGIHWLKTEGGRYYCRYPFGLSLLQAIPFWLLGPTAAMLLNPLLASLTLLGFFLLCRWWVDDTWALYATGVMAINPVIDSRALIADSHTATAFMLVWGGYLLVRWSRSRSVGLAFLLGLVWGYIPTIRYAETIYGIGIAIFLLLHDPRDRQVRMGCIAAVAGAAIPLVALLTHNLVAFGGMLQTGYSLTKEQTGFGGTYFMRGVVPYIQGLHSEGVGLFFPLGIAGITAFCMDRGNRRAGALLAGLIVPVTVLYMSFYYTPRAGGGHALCDAAVLPVHTRWRMVSQGLFRESPEDGLGCSVRAPLFSVAMGGR